MVGAEDMDAANVRKTCSEEDIGATELARHAARSHVLQQAKFDNENLELNLLFDHRWYSLTHLNKELPFGRALAHFLTEGLKQYWDPSPFFPRSIMPDKLNFPHGLPIFSSIISARARPRG